MLWQQAKKHHRSKCCFWQLCMRFFQYPFYTNANQFPVPGCCEFLFAVAFPQSSVVQRVTSWSHFIRLYMAPLSQLMLVLTLIKTTKTTADTLYFECSLWLCFSVFEHTQTSKHNWSSIFFSLRSLRTATLRNVGSHQRHKRRRPFFNFWFDDGVHKRFLVQGGEKT